MPTTDPYLTPDQITQTILHGPTEHAQALVGYLSRCTALHRDVATVVAQHRQEPGIYSVDQMATMLRALVEALGDGRPHDGQLTSSRTQQEA